MPRRLTPLHLTLLLVALQACAGCRRGPTAPPTLATLAASDAEDAGERLMDLDEGMHRLDAARGPRRTAIVAVHGYASEGREWVAPLLRLGAGGAELWFYRWSWTQCPASAAAELADALQDLSRRAPHLERVVLVGHSYGGLIATLVTQSVSLGRPTEVHIVAAPLTRLPGLGRLCPFDGVPRQAPAAGNTWRQWRTRHRSDGAFRDLEVDPQVVELPDLEVVELPATWRGGRLGHNRSLTWVAERLAR